MYDSKLPIGTNYCKCPTCGLYFTSAAAFDKHRTGKYQPDERRCLSVEEMVTKGMAMNDRGYWVSARNPAYATH